MKRDAGIDPDLIGTHCIVTDPIYGSYKAVIRGSHKGFADAIRIDVTILECISSPSDKAIINKNASVRRLPYPIGSLQHFSSDQVKPLAELTA